MRRLKEENYFNEVHFHRILLVLVLDDKNATFLLVQGGHLQMGIFYLLFSRRKREIRMSLLHLLFLAVFGCK